MNKNTALVLGFLLIVLTACGRPVTPMADSQGLSEGDLVEFEDTIYGTSYSTSRGAAALGGQFKGCLRSYLMAKLKAVCGDTNGQALLSCLREHKAEFKQNAQAPIAKAKTTLAQLKTDCCPSGVSVRECVQGIRSGSIAKSQVCQSGIDSIRGNLTSACQQF